MHKAGIMLTEEESFNSVPAGLRFLDLMHCTLSRMPFVTLDLATAHNSSCKVRYLCIFIRSFADCTGFSLEAQELVPTKLLLYSVSFGCTQDT